MLSLRAIAIILSFSAWIAVVNASPIEKRSTFKYRAKSRATHHRTGTHAMLRTFRKYGFSTTGMKTNTTTYSKPAQQTGEVQANPEPNESEFLEKVTVGGQDLNLDFDTGSSDLWVFSDQLSQSAIGQHAAFDPQKSKTFQEMPGAAWEITYGDGSGAAGNVGTDTVEIGGATVTQQVVELATAISQSFAQDTNNDGLLGLAFSVLNTGKHLHTNILSQHIH